jgi:hypothetical protein
MVFERRSFSLLAITAKNLGNPVRIYSRRYLIKI